jgi:excisionase family DNA binding protein
MGSQAVTVREAAETLRVSGDTVRRWADAGLIPAWRLPSGHRRFDPAVVQLFEKRLRSGVSGGEVANGR